MMLSKKQAILVWCIIIIGIILLLSSCNCSQNNSQGQSQSHEQHGRIHGVESFIYGNTRFIIIEVDGKEYLTTTEGGIIQLPYE